MFQTPIKSYSSDTNGYTSNSNLNSNNIETKNMSNLNNFLSIQNLNDSNQTINSVGDGSSISTTSSSFLLKTNDTSLGMNSSGMNTLPPLASHKYSFSSDISNYNTYFPQQNNTSSNSNIYIDYLTSNNSLDPNSTPTSNTNPSTNIPNNGTISSSSANNAISNYKYSAIFQPPQPSKKNDPDLSKLKLNSEPFISQFTHSDDSGSNLNTPISSCFDNQSITYSSSMLSPKAPSFFPSSMNGNNNNNLSKLRVGRSSISSNSYTSSLKNSGSMSFNVNANGSNGNNISMDPKFSLSNSMSNLNITNSNSSINTSTNNTNGIQLSPVEMITTDGSTMSSPPDVGTNIDLKIMQTQFEQLQKQYNKLQELIQIKNNKNELFRDSKNNFSLQIEIPSRLGLILERLLVTLNSKEQELNDTKDRLEALITTVSLNPNKSMTKFGQFDEQEICHKFVTRLHTLSEENNEMGKLLQFGRSKEKDIEIGLLKQQNIKLKEKIKFLEESVTK